MQKTTSVELPATQTAAVIQDAVGASVQAEQVEASGFVPFSLPEFQPSLEGNQDFNQLLNLMNTLATQIQGTAVFPEGTDSASATNAAAPEKADAEESKEEQKKDEGA